ncbi:MAG TPA: hypothetical protein VFA18_25360, partial [Gemmataceae bacterium]|nr:hypothetical protein [Gemmataceae bacterium]
MHPRWFLTVAALGLGCSVAWAGSFSVTLKVVDPDDRPVAGAEAGLFWDVQKGVMKATAYKSARTDAAGRAVLQVDDWNEKRPVLVLSADRRLGGLMTVSRADEGKERTVTLRPTIHVTAKLRCRELPSKPPSANTNVFLDGARPFFVQNSTAPEFVLPPGKYRFWFFSTD